MDDGPKFKTVLEAIRCQDAFDNLRSEFMFGPTPESGKAELRVGVHGRFFENTLFRMEKLTNERVVEPRLPLLNESEFEATVVGSFNKKRNWSPNVQVVVIFPKTKGQFCLDKLVIGKWEKFSGATVLAVQGMLHGRPNVKFGLHVHDVRETNVNALRKEKCLRKKIVGGQRRAPQVIEMGTPFQNCLQLLIWSEAMNDGQHHHSGLDAAKPLKRRDCGSHGEGCENIDDQDHQVKNLQIGLKHFVLEFPPEEWS